MGHYFLAKDFYFLNVCRESLRKCEASWSPQATILEFGLKKKLSVLTKIGKSKIVMREK